MLIASTLYIAISAINYSKKDSHQAETPALYSDQLKKEDVSYQRCIESADSELDSSARDPMEGTIISRESIAQTAREDCNRKHENQMRLLEDQYQ